MVVVVMGVAGSQMSAAAAAEVDIVDRRHYSL